MMTQPESSWPILLVAVVAVLLVAWWMFKRATTAPRRERRPDVLDEGAAPAQRNQALIDAAPPAATFAAASFTAPPAGELMGGMAEVIAAAVHEETPEAGPADDLTRIKGLGPKLAVLLNALGITTFAQIAALTESDLAELDPKLGAFAGRPTRDQWTEQARLLTGGDTAAYEAKFGKL